MLYSNTSGAFIYQPPAASQETSRSRTTASVKKDPTVLPVGEPIPVVYGSGVRVTGRPIYLKVINNVLYGIYLIAEGEIQAYADIKVNDATPTAGMIITMYYGTQDQAVCGLHSVDATWTAPLAGLAYLYVRISTSLSSLPTITAKVTGKKIYDPRTSQTAWSNNPALILADMLVTLARGNATIIDWPSVTEAANYCDQIISGTEKRYVFNYAFQDLQQFSAAVDFIRLHFLGAVLPDMTGFKIICNKARSVSADLTDDNVWDLVIPTIGSEDLANKINFSYIDSATEEIIDDYMLDPALGTFDEIHEMTYDLTGCGISQATRIATYLLNTRLLNMAVEFSTFNDNGLEPGDVFTLTHSIGLTAKQLFITQIKQNGDGSSRIAALESDPAVFSNAIVSEPTYPDTELPLPGDVPTEIAGGPYLQEILEQLLDKTWISNLDITWDESAFPFVDHYEVWLSQDGGTPALQGITTGTHWQVRALVELSTYTIRIVTVSQWRVKSDGVSDSLMIYGKYYPPTWKAGAAMTGAEAGDIVFLSWYMPDGTSPAEDIDLWRYQIRRGRTTDTWETAEVIEPRVDALTFRDPGCPSGDWRFFLKAIDTVENETATALSCDVSVTKNPYLGFQSDFAADMQSFTGTNVRITMDNMIVPTDPLYDTLGERFPGANLNTGIGGTYTYLPMPAENAADATSAAIDLGHILSGKFSLDYGWQKLGAGTASLSPKLLLSENGTDYTEYSAAAEFTGKARYVKVKFIFASSALDTTYIVKDHATVSLKLTPIEEYGTTTVNLSQTITFLTNFISIEKVQAPSVNYAGDGLDPRIAVWDNLSITGGALRVFDKNNAPANGVVHWKVEGF